MKRDERRVVVLASAVVLAAVLALVLWQLGDPRTTSASGSARPSATPSVPDLRHTSSSPSSTPDPTGSEGGDGGSGSDEGEDEDEDGEPVNEEGVEVGARAGTAGLPAAQQVRCPPASVRVGSTEELELALDEAGPGTVIELADGRYEGGFVATASGTAADPAWLCGGSGAVLDGGGTGDGYVVHLDGADYWRLVGFTVRNGQKGVMADGTTGSVVQGLTVTEIGDEAIHLRAHSTDNLVIGNDVSRTGLRREKFGEGVYIGTAVSNWCTVTDCLPDRSDRNVVAQNTFRETTAESIDIKEGTVGGLVVGNTFDGSGITAVDSWVDVKGTAWLIQGNRGSSTPLDGFQTHQILDRWGERNVFQDNEIDSSATTDEDGDSGYGIAVRPVADNVVRCDNSVTGGIELANVPCT